MNRCTDEQHAIDKEARISGKMNHSSKPKRITSKFRPEIQQTKVRVLYEIKRGSHEETHTSTARILSNSRLEDSLALLERLRIEQPNSYFQHNVRSDLCRTPKVLSSQQLESERARTFSQTSQRNLQTASFLSLESKLLWRKD